MKKRNAVGRAQGRKRLSIVQKVVVVAAIGAVGALLIGFLSVRSQDQYNDRLDSINTIRQGAIVSSGLQRGGAEVIGAQEGYAWAIHRDGVDKALAPNAPERAAYLKAVEGLQANLKKMPVAVLTDAEKVKFTSLSEAWKTFQAVSYTHLDVYKRQTPYRSPPRPPPRRSGGSPTAASPWSPPRPTPICGTPTSI